jgi:hypothetical protein
VRLDDGGFFAVGIGIRGWSTERLSPVSCEPLDMLGVEAVAEGMGDHLVGHHATMPRVGKTAEAVASTRRLEDSLHAGILTIARCFCKTMMAASSAATSARVYGFMVDESIMAPPEPERIHIIYREVSSAAVLNAP